MNQFATSWGLVRESEPWVAAAGQFSYVLVRPHGDEDGWERMISRPGASCRCTGDEPPVERVTRRLWRTRDGRRWLQDETVTGPLHPYEAARGWVGVITANLGEAEDISHLLVGP